MEGSVSKGDFAAIIGVSPGRISQYIAAGKISAASLVGQGRNARIDVERAKADLRNSLDISQRLGNGIDTRLDPDLPLYQPPASQPLPGSYTPPPLAPVGIDNDIKAEKLKQLQRANRAGAIVEAQNRGQLIETAAARAEIAKAASSMLQMFEGSLAEIASAVSAEFKMPQRDVLHLMRKKFREVRQGAADKMRKLASDVPASLETELDGDDIESLN
jgi:hypothetical protein